MCLNVFEVLTSHTLTINLHTPLFSCSYPAVSMFSEGTKSGEEQVCAPRTHVQRWKSSYEHKKEKLSRKGNIGFVDEETVRLQCCCVQISILRSPSFYLGHFPG